MSVCPSICLTHLSSTERVIRDLKLYFMPKGAHFMQLCFGVYLCLKKVSDGSAKYGFHWSTDHTISLHLVAQNILLLSCVPFNNSEANVATLIRMEVRTAHAPIR